MMMVVVVMLSMMMLVVVVVVIVVVVVMVSDGDVSLQLRVQCDVMTVARTQLRSPLITAAQ